MMRVDAVNRVNGWAIEHTKAGDIIAHSGDNPGYADSAGHDHPRGFQP
jgi:hypothetical protein